jgi:acetylornithine deacetylase/succinyl-diaminopimelate desuccinylase-like protein
MDSTTPLARAVLRALACTALLIAPTAFANDAQLATLRKQVAAQHDTTVQRLRDWIAVPSIAAEDLNYPQGADYMSKLLTDAGFQHVETIKTDGKPGVFATLDAGAPTTMAIYFMYDVKHYDPAEWSSPPLEARIVDRPGEGKAIVGRGAVNQKGPESAFLAMLHAFKDSKTRLPVNLVLVAEGEEEIGSTHFSQIVLNPEVRPAIEKAVGVIIPSASQGPDGDVTLSLGAKGVVELQLISSGEKWGRGPKNDIHSSNMARIENPAWHLVKALDTLVADDGYTPAVEGWFEHVKPLTARQKELIAANAAATDEAKLKASMGVQHWIKDEDLRTSLERLASQPTINIQGIVSGYTGPGGKTVLPGRAEAKIDTRLVPDMTKDEMVAKLKAHLAKHGFGDIEVNVTGGYSPTQTDENSALIKAETLALKNAGIKYTLYPRSAGSWPGVVFTGAPLGLPAGQYGIGRGNGAHAPNEWFLIESSNPKVAGLDEQAMLYADFLYTVADQAKKK